MKINPFRKKESISQAGAIVTSSSTLKVSSSLSHLPAGQFPTHALPECIKGMVCQLAAHSSLPIAMIALAALAVVSAAIGRKFSTQLSWLEDVTLCNLIVLLGSPTTSGKGILSKLLAAFLNHELKLLEAHELRLAEYELDCHLSEERYSLLRKDIAKKEALGLSTIELRPLALDELRKKRNLTQLLSRRPAYCMRHPTGAALRDAFAGGDQSIFLFSLDGASCLMDAITGKDRNLRRYILSGFSGEETGSETATQGKFGGEVCLSSLFSMQPHLLREMLFSEQAAQAGLLNRPLIVDYEFLDEGVCQQPTTTLDAGGWNKLIQSMFEYRFSASEALSLKWKPAAEAEFKAFDAETQAALKGWPENAREHSGRVTELSVRLAGIFLAISVIHEKRKAEEESVHLDAAKRAVEIMRWTFRHRLRIQADAYRKFLACQASDLEKKLKAKGGNLLVSEIRDAHPQLLRHLDAILDGYPQRFIRGTRKPKRGPEAEAILLID